MRLFHPPDGSTSPKYKLLCFKPPKFILLNTEYTSFSLGYVLPSSALFMVASFPLGTFINHSHKVLQHWPLLWRLDRCTLFVSASLTQKKFATLTPALRWSGRKWSRWPGRGCSSRRRWRVERTDFVERSCVCYRWCHRSAVDGIITKFLLPFLVT
jgi:hypothetical protein